MTIEPTSRGSPQDGTRGKSVSKVPVWALKTGKPADQDERFRKESGTPREGTRRATVNTPQVGFGRKAETC
jgi:hypothetical protein